MIATEVGGRAALGFQTHKEVMDCTSGVHQDQQKSSQPYSQACVSHLLPVDGQCVTGLT